MLPLFYLFFTITFFVRARRCLRLSLRGRSPCCSSVGITGTPAVVEPSGAVWLFPG